MQTSTNKKKNGLIFKLSTYFGHKNLRVNGYEILCKKRAVCIRNKISKFRFIKYKI